jgi:hypothetical protein
VFRSREIHESLPGSAARSGSDARPSAGVLFGSAWGLRVNAKDAENGDGKTEFGRSAERVGIGLINALTPLIMRTELA